MSPDSTSTKRLLVYLAALLVVGITTLSILGRPADSLVTVLMLVVGTGIVGGVVGNKVDQASEHAHNAADRAGEALDTAKRVEEQTNGVMSDLLARVPSEERDATLAVQQEQERQEHGVTRLSDAREGRHKA